MTYAAQKNQATTRTRTFSGWQSTKPSSGSTSGSGRSPIDKDEIIMALNILGKILPEAGYCDGVMPSEESIKLTENLINNLPLNYLHASTIQPDGEGGITMTWIKENEDRTILTIDGDKYHLSTGPLHGPATYIHDRQYFDENFKPVPSDIMANLPKRPSSRVE